MRTDRPMNMRKTILSTSIVLIILPLCLAAAGFFRGITSSGSLNAQINAQADTDKTDAVQKNPGTGTADANVFGDDKKKSDPADEGQPVKKAVLKKAGKNAVSITPTIKSAVIKNAATVKGKAKTAIAPAKSDEKSTVTGKQKGENRAGDSQKETGNAGGKGDLKQDVMTKQDDKPVSGEKEPQTVPLEEKAEQEGQEEKMERQVLEPHIIIINPGERIEGVNWSGVYNHETIALWAKTKGMLLRDDSGPLVGGVAGFIHKYGTRFVVRDLSRERKYYLYIDFVIFDKYNEKKHPTELKIFAKNADYGETLISALQYKNIKKKNPYYRMQIPYKFTVKGQMDLIFREYSPMKGYWGVWDMIISDSAEITDSMIEKALLKGMENDQLKESDHVVEIK